MSDLVAFLTARLNEDEAAAKAATGKSAWSWRGIGRQLDERPSVADTIHIARHDPARVLREVGFKRGIVEDHGPNYPTIYPKPAGKPYCGSCNQGSWDVDYMDWPCLTILALAAVYDGHPDYDAAWAPGSP